MPFRQILRLEALKKHGGVYLDLDVYVLKGLCALSSPIDLPLNLVLDFAPFYTHSTVMAQEGYPDEPDRLEPGGLCNAVIMAEPYSPFIVCARHQLYVALTHTCCGLTDPVDGPVYLLHRQAMERTLRACTMEARQAVPRHDLCSWSTGHLLPVCSGVLLQLGLSLTTNCSLWTAPHMELVYETTNYDFDASGQYA